MLRVRRRRLRIFIVKPISIRIQPSDNVAVIVNPEGLRAGVELDGGLRLREDIPQAHKVALTALAAGDPIIRYGAVIGRAAEAMAPGGWVREDLVEMPAAPELDVLPLATAVPGDPEPFEGYTFEGFLNPDGSVGTKNVLGITTTVQCVAPTVDHAADRIRRELLPRFSNVDDVVPITHAYGCGVAINAPDAPIPIRSIRNLSRNPNFGGEPLVVSLGCEKMQPDRLFPEAALAAAWSTPPRAGALAFVRTWSMRARAKPPTSSPTSCSRPRRHRRSRRSASSGASGCSTAG